MFLTPQDSIGSILQNNLETFTKDYLWLKENNMFYDYNNMDDIVENRKDTGHFWQVAPFIYNKEILHGLPASFEQLDTVKIVQSISPKPILATFSVLKPHSKIDDHEDHDEDCIAGVDDTHVVKYHFGINVSSEGSAGMVVNNETSSVLAGKLNVFNESNPHYAFNNTPQDRCVLILSFLASDLDE